MEQSSSAILSLLKYCTFSHKKRTIVFLGPGLVPFHFQHKTATLLCPFDFCIPLVADYPTNSVLYFFFFLYEGSWSKREDVVLCNNLNLCAFFTLKSCNTAWPYLGAQESELLSKNRKLWHMLALLKYIFLLLRILNLYTILSNLTYAE